MQLTQAQEDLINTAEHTHDYNALVDSDLDAQATEDLVEKYLSVFERETQIRERSTAQDLGGLFVYTNAAGELVAFYDYETFVGTVFD